MMVGSRFKQAIVATALAIAASALAPGATQAETAAIRNCTWCHGGNAQGYATAPRLAGQRPLYIENQLAAFGNHSRDNPFSKLYMWAAAKYLSRERVHDLALYFASIPPRTAADGDRELAATGETIYQQGMPDANIVACVVCHGPNAEGIRQIPRLGGLSYSYLKRRLEQWGQGYHAAVGPPMPSISGKLSTGQIEALASYLSFLH